MATAVVCVVLAGLLMPLYKKSLQKAAAATCVNNLRQLGAGFHAYLGENNMMIPTQVTGSGGSGVAGSFFEKVAPYANWTRPMTASTSAAQNTFMHCPAHTEQPGSFSYRLSAFLVASPSGAVPGSGLANNQLSYLAVKSPSSKVLAWEIHTSCQWPLATHYNVGTGKLPFSPLFSKATFTHGTGSNYLFADGHAETRSDGLQDYKWWQYDK